jgi:hypothetical protein
MRAGFDAIGANRVEPLAEFVAAKQKAWILSGDPGLPI